MFLPPQKKFAESVIIRLGSGWSLGDEVSWQVWIDWKWVAQSRSQGSEPRLRHMSSRGALRSYMYQPYLIYWGKNGKVTPIQFPSFARAAGLHLTAPGCQRPASRWRIDLWDSLGSTLQLEKQQLVFVQGWNSLKINNPTPICNTLQKHAKTMIDHLGGVGYWGEGID